MCVSTNVDSEECLAGRVWDRCLFGYCLTLCPILTGFCLLRVNYVGMRVVDRFRLCFDLCYSEVFVESGLSYELM